MKRKERRMKREKRKMRIGNQREKNILVYECIRIFFCNFAKCTLQHSNSIDFTYNINNIQ